MKSKFDHDKFREFIGQAGVLAFAGGLLEGSIGRGGVVPAVALTACGIIMVFIACYRR